MNRPGIASGGLVAVGEPCRVDGGEGKPGARLEQAGDLDAAAWEGQSARPTASLCFLIDTEPGAAWTGCAWST
jgi:hypothetical protein